MKEMDPQSNQSVLRPFHWGARVDEVDVGAEFVASAVNRVAAPNRAKRDAAQEATRRVGGVARDGVEVEGGQRTDSEIAYAVKNALEWDVLVPELGIYFVVFEGWVTLLGTVDHWSQRHDAERAVRNLARVRGVSNEIDIKLPKLIARDVRRSIEEALERQAAREARSIDLDVCGGHVILSGVVHSRAERDAVVGATRGTPGVRRVEDHLHVRPHRS